MKTVQWEMKEQFAFPEFAGIPAKAVAISVTPRFTEERDEDAVRLTGIYHIAANVSFNEGERAAELSEKVILVDDVDLEEQVGYFEYAVPLNIDLPAEAGTPLDVVVKHSKSEVDGQGVFGVVWNVECSYPEAVALVPETAEVEEEAVAESEAVQTAIAIINKSSINADDEVLSFIGELQDGLSATLFRSNDVFVKRESEPGE
ncbi:hypothetical protein ACXYMX_05475 [Sporosarcina sp. CAU 1771]